MATVLLPFPEIPTEISREILECAAASSSETAVALTLVSSWVRLWALPVIYRTVTLSSAHAITSFLDATADANTASYRFLNPFSIRSYVHTLGIFALGPLSDIAELLSTCKNVQNLAYGFSFSSYCRIILNNAIFGPPKTQREHHLLGFSCRDGVDFTYLSPSTTHLHLQISQRDLGSLISLTTFLPELTHLAVSLPSTAVASWDTVVSDLFAILKECPYLEIFFVQVARSSSAGGIDPTETRIPDDRLVVLHAPMSCVAQWERTLQPSIGGFWIEAERAMRRRRMKSRFKFNDEGASDGGTAVAGQTFAGLRRLTKIDVI